MRSMPSPCNPNRNPLGTLPRLGHCEAMTPRVNPDRPSSLSFRNKVGRALWGLVAATLFRASPVPFHGARRAILRLFGAKIAATGRVYPTARIWAPWNLTVGEHSVVGPGVIVYSVSPIVLKEYVVVSQYAHLCSASHDYRDPQFPLIHAPIVIEDGAWVCTEAFIGMGVTIGREAVIGARAVVTRDMPAGMVCAGHPCKPIKPRFPEANA